MSKELTSMDIENTQCGVPNIPGIKKIEYIPVKWIELWPEFIDTNNTITTPIQLIAGKNWLLASFSTKTSKYIEKLKSNNKGLKYESSITAFISLDTPKISELFNSMARNQFIVKLTDKNNLVRIVGTPITPLSFSSDLSTGKKGGDTKGYSYTFFGDLFDKAPFYIF